MIKTPTEPQNTRLVCKPGATAKPIQGVRRSRMKPIKVLAARAMRKAPTPAESILWQSIRKYALGFKFRRQACMWGYIADFYAPKLHLVIELDGSAHCYPDRIQNDQRRDVALALHGITTIRFSNADVLQNLPHILEQITQFANSQRISKKATRRLNPARHNRLTRPTAINTP